MSLATVLGAAVSVALVSSLSLVSIQQAGDWAKSFYSS